MEKIIVGVSQLAGDHPAIDWAIQFAKDRAASVQLVHVIDTTWGNAPLDFIETALLKAEEQLRDRVAAARRDFPGVAVGSHVWFGSPVTELINSAEKADFLVVGAHPKSRGDGAGRRAVRLARLAPCSVIVVPSNVVPTGTGVVVGVDGSVESDLAVEFAAAFADRHQETLTAILAWGHPEAWGFTEPVLVESEPSDEDRLIIAESIAGLASQYPDLTVRTEVSGSRPERALTAAGIGARLLVVGSRGRHGLAKALLGSVSEDVVSDLPCAVAVIREANPSS